MVESTFGQELRRLRCAAGLSLRGLARQAHYDPGYLSKVENGIKQPTSDLATACDRAMGTGGLLTGLVSAHIVPGTSAHPEPDHLRQGAGIRLAEGDLDWERIGYFDERTSPLDLVTVDEYTALNAHLWRVFMTSRHKDVISHRVRKHLDVLISSLHKSYGPAIYQRLYAITGDLFQLAGEIFFDSSQYTDAAHCYTLAATASKEAGAFDLWACAMIRHAFISVYERQFNKAAPMLELAVGLAHRGDGTLSTCLLYTSDAADE